MAFSWWLVNLPLWKQVTTSWCSSLSWNSIKVGGVFPSYLHQLDHLLFSGSGIPKKKPLLPITSGQSIATSHDQKPKWWFSKENLLLSGKSGADYLDLFFRWICCGFFCSHGMNFIMGFTTIWRCLFFQAPVGSQSTMGPQNHEKWRFWPHKNQVIYHKNFKKYRFWGPKVSKPYFQQVQRLGGESCIATFWMIFPIQKLGRNSEGVMGILDFPTSSSSSHTETEVIWCLDGMIFGVQEHTSRNKVSLAI